MRTKLLPLITVLAVTLAIAGCPNVDLSGINLDGLLTGVDGPTPGGEATPPGPENPPPSENPPGDQPDDDQQTPQYRVLPEKITLALDEMNVETESVQSGPGMTYLEIGQEQAGITMTQLDEIMARFAYINSLITSPADVQIADTIVWDTRISTGIPGPGGSRVANPGSGAGDVRNIKVDFSAFDFDGDGIDDGSGDPVTAPVALRVWVTDSSGVYQPAACGLIETLPTPMSAGAGTFHTLSYARNGDGDVAVIEWDEDDPNNQLLETWDEHPEGAGWGYSSFLVQHEITPGALQKTVKSTIGNEYVVVRYLDTAAAAAVAGDTGSAYAALLATPPTIDYFDLATGGAATAADAGGVSTTDLDVLEQPNPSVFPWPASFPVTPTF